MPIRLFVRNLPYNATEAELREHFSVVGQISYLALPTDRETGKPRGFAFLEFNNPAEAEEAIRRFNNQLFKGRPLSVSKALPKTDRPPSSPPNRPARPSFHAVSEPDIASPPPDNKRSRDFGPDAAPFSRRNKGKNSSRSERTPKGPMREKVRGQFFGNDDDADDDFNDEELNRQDLDSSLADDESDDKP